MKKGEIIAGAVIAGFLFYSFKGSNLTAKSINACNMAFGDLSDTQVSSITYIVQEFEKLGDGHINKLAYILATAWHESRLTPIKEYRANSGTALYATQNNYWYTGFYGRGFVQLTWQTNYAKMSAITGVDLVSNPDLALQPQYAAKILVYGMLKGSFTGKKLNDYINTTTLDYYNARRIVNGLDKATLIQGYTQDVESKLI